MARCKECFHYAVCAKESRLVQIDEHTWDDYNQLDDVERICDNYVSNTDVAPPSDIERLSAIIWKLKQENLLPVHSMIKNASLQVAREIFEEIEREIKNHGICYAQRKIAELKKKYTGE